MAERIPKRLRGKRRREVETPLIAPEVNDGAVLQFRAWRSQFYRKPILDDLTGHYRFYPSKAGLQTYTRPDVIKMPEGIVAVGPEEARKLIAQKQEKQSSQARQRLHIAGSTEFATALFWNVALLRKAMLIEAIARAADDEQPEWDVAGYAADAILDLGLCMEKPYEADPRYRDKKGRPMPSGLRTRLDQIDPQLGTQLVDFGAFASEHRDILRSADGLILMEAALEEQDYRIRIWEERHSLIREVFPQVGVSEDILYQRLSLQEMLDIECNLADQNR